MQKVSDKIWKNESGTDVPVEYVSRTARLKERHSSTILKDAKSIHGKLVTFKKKVNKLCQEVLEMAMEEYKANKGGKGNFTWFNFDRSIKIEVSINNRIEFDDLAIKAAKEKLDIFLTENLDSKIEFVKDLVFDAFSTSGGKIDTKKVMGLNRYRTKIHHPLFQEALDILSNGMSKPDSKTYFRVWTRDDAGKYHNVDLNFSSI